VQTVNGRLGRHKWSSLRWSCQATTESPGDDNQAPCTPRPVLVITDPFASIILSIWLFDQRFTDSQAKITVAVLAFAVRAC
jgi:hypothetical protein